MSSLHDVYFCQIDRTEELSKRMANRNIPDTQLDTAYFSRPSSTRFVKFPTVDNRKKSTIEKAIMKEFSVETSFNPGTSAPFSGYQKNVDVENKLRNINFPLQRGAQSKYIPNSFSNMYMTSPDLMNNSLSAPMPMTQKQEKFDKCNPNQENIGNKIFQNHTRQQTKNLYNDLIKT